MGVYLEELWQIQVHLLVVNVEKFDIKKIHVGVRIHCVIYVVGKTTWLDIV